jgi:hypothetical protein
VFTLIDAAGLLLAALLYIPLLILPGYAIARASGALGYATATASQRFVLALLLAHAVLPALNALVSTLIGLDTAIAATLFLAGLGVLAIWTDGAPRPTARQLVMAAAWIGFVVFIWIDVEWQGRLYQSLLTVDMIKHASITRSLADAGVAPPTDPFFAREGFATFYYFYFVATAMAERLGGGLIDARAAVGGQIFWTGIALLGLALQLYRAAGLGRTRPLATLFVLLAMTSGVQLLTVLFTRLVAGLWMPQVNWVNEMVGGWFLSLIWVPHHVAGLIAAWVALLLLLEARLTSQPRTRAVAIILAGIACASTAGQSLWVSFGLAATVLLWALYLLHRERSIASLGLLAASGVIAILVAAPYLHGLLVNRAGDIAPVTLAVRPFVYADLAAATLAEAGLPGSRTLLRLVLLPLNYLHEFGLFALGGILFWSRRRRIAPVNDTMRLLIASTLAAFLVGSFLRSTISNNDLGWRVMLFAQMSLLLWTAHVLAPLWRRVGIATFARRLPPAASLLLAIGLGGLAYDIAMLRFGYAFDIRLPGGDLREPRVDLDVRRTYDWLNRNVPRDVVLQHNPDAERAFGFALYGRNPVGVSDRHSPFLLGAAKAAVEQRLAAMLPIFRDAMPSAAVAATAHRHGIRLLLVTAVDPVWQKKPEWLTGPALFETATVRVIDVAHLQR